MIILPPAPAPADTATKVAALPELPTTPTPDAPVDAVHDVRIALATAAQEAPVTATGPWRLYDGGNGVIIRGRTTDAWTVHRNGNTLRAVARSGAATPWVESPLTLRPDTDAQFVIFAGRRYRGALRLVATDSGLTVVNVLGVEDYLRGVVPLEIGVNRGPSDQAAVEAQAIAARSYTWVRLGTSQTNPGRGYDMAATVADQVYGGADAEREATDRAVSTTAGQVLKFGGRVVDAPYSASCGGESAAPDEVWRVSGTSAYLRRVSDRIPGSADRYYCDIAPRFSWTRTFTTAELDAAARSYLRQYTDGLSGTPSHVRGISIESRTPSGRVARTVFLTDRGSYAVRGNDVRYVLRTAGGEILNSTYFSVNAEAARDGALVRVVLRGNGYGHGVGMCQWGAIGRARAGQTARSILAAYYPGTSVGPAS
jgi:stage II sporulation protein D